MSRSLTIPTTVWLESTTGIPETRWSLMILVALINDSSGEATATAVTMISRTGETRFWS